MSEDEEFEFRYRAEQEGRLKSRAAGGMTFGGAPYQEPVPVGVADNPRPYDPANPPLWQSTMPQAKREVGFGEALGRGFTEAGASALEKYATAPVWLARVGQLAKNLYTGQPSQTDLVEQAKSYFQRPMAEISQRNAIDPRTEQLTGPGIGGNILGQFTPLAAEMALTRTPGAATRAGAPIIENSLRMLAKETPGAANAAATMMFQRKNQLEAEGVPTDVAERAAVSSFAPNIAGFAVPAAAPGRFLQRATTGGIAGIGTDIPATAAENRVLMQSGYPQSVQDLLDPTRLAISGGLGAAVGGVLGPRQAPIPTRADMGYAAGPAAEPSRVSDLDMERYRDILAANGVTDPTDPRAQRLVDTLNARTQREAERRPGQGDFPMYRTDRQGNIQLDAQGNPIPSRIRRDKEGNIIQPRDVVQEAMDQIAAEQMHPSAAPWVGRQGEAPPPIVQVTPTGQAMGVDANGQPIGIDIAAALNNLENAKQIQAEEARKSNNAPYEGLVQPQQPSVIQVSPTGEAVPLNARGEPTSLEPQAAVSNLPNARELQIRGEYEKAGLNPSESLEVLKERYWSPEQEPARTLKSELDNEQVGLIEHYMGVSPEELSGLGPNAQRKLLARAMEAQAADTAREGAGPFQTTFTGGEERASPRSRPNVPGERMTARSEYEDVNARLAQDQEAADLNALRERAAAGDKSAIAQVRKQEAEAKKAAAQKTQMIEALQGLREQRDRIANSQDYKTLKRKRDLRQPLDEKEQKRLAAFDDQYRKLGDSIFRMESKIYDISEKADLATRAASGAGDRPFRGFSEAEAEHAGFFEQQAREKASKAEQEMLDRLEAEWRARESQRTEREQRQGERKQDKTTEKGTNEAVPPKDGIFDTNADGLVMSTNGNPIHFDHQRAAGWWILKKGNKVSGGQVFEIANHPSGEGFSVRETLRNEPGGGGPQGGPKAETGGKAGPGGPVATRAQPKAEARPRQPEPEAKAQQAHEEPGTSDERSIFRVSDSPSGGGIMIEVHYPKSGMDPNGRVKSYYIGTGEKAGSLVDADHINLNDPKDVNRIWKPDEAQRKQAEAILREMGPMSIEDPKRPELARRLNDLRLRKTEPAAKQTPEQPTPEQPQQPQPRPTRKAAPKAERETEPKVRDLLSAIRSWGGIDPYYQEGITGETPGKRKKKKNGEKGKIPTFQGIFRKGGQDLPAIADKMHEDQFLLYNEMNDPTTHPWEHASTLIQRALGGERILSPEDEVRLFEWNQKQEHRAGLVEEIKNRGVKTRKDTRFLSTQDLQAVVDAERAKDQQRLDALDEELAGHVEEGARVLGDRINDIIRPPGPEGHTEAWYRDNIKRLKDEIENEIAYTSSIGTTEADARTAERSGGSHGEESDAGSYYEPEQPTGRGREREPGADEGEPESDFGLKGQTEAGLKGRAEEQERTRKAQEAEQRKADEAARKAREEKEIAARQESSAENFKLGESAEESLAGQGDIFSQANKNREPWQPADGPGNLGRFGSDAKSNGLNDAQRELRYKSHDKEQPGDVALGNGKYASFDDVVRIAKEGIDSGEIKPVPFQLVNRLDLTFRDVDRVLEAATKKGPDESGGGSDSGTLYANPFGKALGWAFGDTKQWANSLNQLKRSLRDLRGAKGKDGGIKQAVTDFVRAVFDSAGADIRAHIKKNGDSETARWVADQFHEQAGSGRATGETYSNAVEARVGRRLVQLHRLLGDLVNDEGAMKQLTALVRSGRAKPGTRLGDAAIAIRKMLNEELQYLRGSGVEMGEVKDGYFPREYMADKIMNDGKGFIDAATRAFQETGMNKADAIEAAKHLHDSIVFGDHGDIFKSAGGNAAAPFLKGRTFGKEVDNPAHPLNRFLNDDAADALAQYFQRSARRGEIASRFGDGFSKWGDSKDKNGKPVDGLRSKIQKEGGAAAIDRLQEFIGMGAGINPPGTTKMALRTASHLRTWGSLAYLDKASLSSLPEFLTAAIRSGNLGDIGKSLSTTMGDLIRTKGTAESRKIAEDLGLASGHIDAALSTSRFSGGDAVSKIESKILHKFFQRIGLSRLTDSTRVGAVRVAQVVMRRLAKEPDGKLNNLMWAELGVPAEQVPAMKKWINDNGGMVTLDKMKGEMGDMYRVAIRKATHQSVMSPNATHKPRWASTPWGSVLAQLQSFNYAFYENVLKRNARLMKEGISGEGYTNAERAKLMYPMLMTPLLAAGAFAIGEGRDAVLGDPNRRKEETGGEKALKALSRGVPIAPLDPLLNLAAGAKYQRTAAQTFAGPVLGNIATAVDAARDYFLKNSESTNTQERRALRAVWDNFIEPAVNAALYMSPVSPVAAALTQAAGAGQVREKLFMEPLAGKKKEKGEMGAWGGGKEVGTWGSGKEIGTWGAK